MGGGFGGRGGPPSPYEKYPTKVFPSVGQLSQVRETPAGSLHKQVHYELLKGHLRQQHPAILQDAEARRQGARNAARIPSPGDNLGDSEVFPSGKPSFHKDLGL